MFSISFKKRIVILTSLFVVFITVGMIGIDLYDHWLMSIDEEFQNATSITSLLDQQLEGTYVDLLDPDNEMTEEQQIHLLNEKLQPFINQINIAFPTYGAGYYSKELNSIVAFGPNFNKDGLIDISKDSKARTVYQTKKPYKFRDYSQTRQASVIAVIHPIIRNGEVIGHVWGNIAEESVFANFWIYTKDQWPFVIFMIIYGLIGTNLLLHQYKQSLKIFKDRVKNLDSEVKNTPKFPLELMDVYHEVVRSRRQISKREKEFQKIVKQKIIQAQDNERKRVSQDLHDSVGQSLYSILVSAKLLGELNMEARLTDHIHNIERMVSAAMEEVKNIALQLRPSALDDLGLIPAIRSLTQKFQKNFGFDVDLQVCTQVKKRYGSTIEMYLYRICQEALNNIVKYADTKKVHLSISDYDDKLELLIRDEGKGFDFKKVNQERKGMGLTGMQERVALLNGNFKIHSELGKGTTIQVHIPLQDKKSEKGDKVRV